MKLVTFPDPRLRQVCSPVGEVTEDVRRTLSAMARRMAEWNGIGLAAPQCGAMVRMFVAVVPGRGPAAFVDPEVEDAGEGEAAMPEGCLSIPGVTVELARPSAVVVRARDESGAAFEMACRGILARCVQHEVDHLDGVLMVDRLGSPDARLAIQAAWDARFPPRAK